MGYFQTRGLRGSMLEDSINMTNEMYRKKGIALIQKIPTPIKPVRINKENRNISLAYFEKKSTVDYIGIAQGVPICFDAKETNGKSLPLQNIHDHQVDFMADFQKHEGISFLIVYFRKYDEYYVLSYDKLIEYYNKIKSGGRKFISYEEFDKNMLIEVKNQVYINYLEKINELL